MFCTAELDAVISGSAIIALCGIIAENGWSGNIMRVEVFWGIVEKYWVLNAWCDILKKECLCLRRKYKYPF